MHAYVINNLMTLLIIFFPDLHQTVINFRMLSIGEQGAVLTINFTCEKLAM